MTNAIWEWTFVLNPDSYTSPLVYGDLSHPHKILLF